MTSHRRRATVEIKTEMKGLLAASLLASSVKISWQNPSRFASAVEYFKFLWHPLSMEQSLARKTFVIY